MGVMGVVTEMDCVSVGGVATLLSGGGVELVRQVHHVLLD